MHQVRPRSRGDSAWKDSILPDSNSRRRRARPSSGGTPLTNNLNRRKFSAALTKLCHGKKVRVPATLSYPTRESEDVMG